eukprot:scaffold617_cov161-Pinguiococcus_pyrenoidosus.AAC.1
MQSSIAYEEKFFKEAHRTLASPAATQFPFLQFGPRVPGLLLGIGRCFHNKVDEAWRGRPLFGDGAQESRNTQEKLETMESFLPYTFWRHQ